MFFLSNNFSLKLSFTSVHVMSIKTKYLYKVYFQIFGKYRSLTYLRSKMNMRYNDGVRIAPNAMEIKTTWYERCCH